MAQDDSDSAALRVLSDGALLRHAVSFAGGASGAVLAFARRIEPQVAPVYAAASRQWRGVLPFMAAKEDDLRVLQALLALRCQPRYAHSVRLQPQRVVLAAARYGRLSVLQWLLRCDAAEVTWDTGLLREAIWHRHVDVMDWLHTTCARESGDSAGGVTHIDWHARERTLEVVAWLHRHGHAFSAREMDRAAEFGHADVVAFLHRHRTEGCTTRAMDAAAENGYLEIVKFLHDHRGEGCTTRAMDGAAARGHLDVVTFLHARRSEGCTVRAMDLAAVNSHVTVVEFLGQHRREGCSATTLLKAATGGSARTVRALCEFSARGCLVEAKRLALAWKHADVVAVLDAFLSESVRTCSMAQHTPSDTRRRCQRLRGRLQIECCNSSSNSSTRNRMKKPSNSSSNSSSKKAKRRSASWNFSARCGSLWGFPGPGRAPLQLWPPSMLHAYPLQPT